mmetsp:Transcript_19384/g.33494  ORF Transcript_19384/g.33494 Transcript_19384/m.33494 type:complete len:84 (+) Transcript_19384:2585-2836(+)
MSMVKSLVGLKCLDLYFMSWLNMRAERESKFCTNKIRNLSRHAFSAGGSYMYFYHQLSTACVIVLLICSAHPSFCLSCWFLRV